MFGYFLSEYLDPIFLLLGLILVFAGGVQFMLEYNMGPPPGGCSFVLLLLFGVVKTKIGRAGCIIVLVELFTSVQLFSLIFRILY